MEGPSDNTILADLFALLNKSMESSLKGRRNSQPKNVVCLSILSLFKALCSDSLIFSILYTPNYANKYIFSSNPPLIPLVAISLYHLRHEVQDIWL